MAIVEGFSAHFHPDPEKQKDSLEGKLERMGPERTFDSLMEDLDNDPDNQETRRQASLLVNRFEDLTTKLRRKIGN